VYHVCNRGSRKGVVFETYEDYAAFCELVEEARQKRPMRIVAYCLRKTHFHFLLWPVNDQDLPRFMKWLTSTHARRWHLRRGSVGSGAVYQSRYFARGIADVRGFFTALRYVEANALKDGAVTRAEEWPWGSAWRREGFGSRVSIDDSPIARPSNWLRILNDL
jgi:putative transposase